MLSETTQLKRNKQSSVRSFDLVLNVFLIIPLTTNSSDFTNDLFIGWNLRTFRIFFRVSLRQRRSVGQLMYTAITKQRTKMSCSKLLYMKGLDSNLWPLDRLQVASTTACTLHHRAQWYRNASWCHTLCAANLISSKSEFINAIKLTSRVHALWRNMCGRCTNWKPTTPLHTLCCN